MQHIKVFVMKFLLSSPLFSSLLQISRHLLFARPVNWLFLKAMRLKSTNWPKPRCLQCWQFCLCWPICCQHSRQIFLSMDKNSSTIDFMVGQFFMILLLVLSGLRMKSLLELEKIWWLRNALNNGYGNWLLLKFTPYIVNSDNGIFNAVILLRITRISARLSSFLELVHIIKMILPNNIFKFVIYKSSFQIHHLCYKLMQV